ncbi:MAG: chromosomal replication initiator protein DnaA [Phycisphaeraceae bacterium]|nr:chromosomal replication initiator protein DnaA [Phycisphaeraceae bacterium]MBX3407569.1 chromosomal replication initiator protein DnaA [Phycisphaeraceae bacterium]
MPGLSTPTRTNLPDRQMWGGMLAHLRSGHPEICRQWFEEIEPLGIAGGVLRLRAHSQIHRDYLQRTCLEPFNDAARTVSERLISVQFLGPDDRVDPAPPATPLTSAAEPRVVVRSDAARAAIDDAPPRTRDAQPVEREVWPTTPRTTTSGAALTRAAHSHSLVLNPDYVFENFVVGPGSRLAHAAAVAVAEKPGRAYNPYFVHGDVGLGKTHLLQAICLRIKQADPATKIYYTSCEGFMTQFMEAVQAGEMAAFRHTFRDVDVLAIDDVHFLAKRDRTQEEFFHTFNSLYQAHKQIILSSDAPPEEIPDLEDRLVSRFKWGLVASVAPPCYETRVEILKQKARLRGFEIPDDVACHIAAKIDTNIRELEGAVVKLQVLRGLEKRDVDMGLALAALGDEAARNDRTVQIQTIIDAVTDFFGVKVSDLQSKRRQRSIALPRQVCMFLARRHTRFSLEEIGGFFGGRDHTTVMHAVKTIEARLDSDAEFARRIVVIENLVKAPAA